MRDQQQQVREALLACVAAADARGDKAEAAGLRVVSDFISREGAAKLVGMLRL